MNLLLAAALAAAAADRPYAGRYAASSSDFKRLERGLRDARKVEEKLFPSLVERVDVVLYDTTYLYVYSKNGGYALPKWKRRAGYQVYRLAHRKRPSEREMARCSGRADVVDKQVRKHLAEQYFTCAPWGTFSAIQKKRRSVYQHEQSYYATVIHELGHQFEAWQPRPTGEMDELRRILSEMKLDPKVEREAAFREGFATWCELEAAKTLYPDHFRRLMEQSAKKRADDDYGHEAGLKAAVALFQARRKPAK